MYSTFTVWCSPKISLGCWVVTRIHNKGLIDLEDRWNIDLIQVFILSHGIFYKDIKGFTQGCIDTLNFLPFIFLCYFKILVKLLPVTSSYRGFPLLISFLPILFDSLITFDKQFDLLCYFKVMFYILSTIYLH